MALLLMNFLSGLDGDYYQEVIAGQVTRWFDLSGNVITLPANNGYGCSYKLKDENPQIPKWYIDQSGN